MKLVMTLVVRDGESDVVDAQIAYHLNAGVDFVIAADQGLWDVTGEILDSYSQAGYLRRVPLDGGEGRASDVRTSMARLAATEYGADWVMDSDADEFWWPRGEDLKDVLAAVPPRYMIVQALVRTYLPRPDNGALFAERMTLRRSLVDVDEATKEPLEWMLRPVYRADPKMVVGFRGGGAAGRRVPLRAWYPIEVFRFPVRTLEQIERQFRNGKPDPRSSLEADALEAYRQGNLAQRYSELVVNDEQLALGLADNSIVLDTRLEHALRELRKLEAEEATQFALPEDGTARLTFRAPDIVDDAAYAVECAAVGEVDIAGLERRIDELAARIARLEERFWPRVVRRLSRPVRRSRR